MSQAAILDLRPEVQRQPSNLEAEQALLGVLLYDNAALEHLDGLEPEHFYEPFHGRLFAAIQSANRAGRIADLVIVAGQFGADPAFNDLGGMRYLAEMVDRAPIPTAAPDYAREIADLATRRALIDATSEAQALLRSGEETPEVVEKLEANLLALQRSQRRARLYSASDAVTAMLAALDAPEGDDRGVMTGLSALDDHLGTMQPDELILVAGRPGAGKSALAACISLNVARRGLGVIEINSEMSVAQMMRRHVSDAAFAVYGQDAPTYKDIKRRQLTQSSRARVNHAADQIGGLPLAMVKRTGLTLSALRSLVRRQTAEWARQGIELGLVTVDHVGLLQADGGGRDRYTDQTNIAIGMKALADELHVPVVALVQLSRKVEERDSKRPQLSDLRDSGAWEENADVAIGVYREAYYANKEQEPKGGSLKGDLAWDEWYRRRHSKVVEAILMKVREGEEATIPLWASIGHNAIRSADPESGGMI